MGFESGDGWTFAIYIQKTDDIEFEELPDQKSKTRLEQAIADERQQPSIKFKANLVQCRLLSGRYEFGERFFEYCLGHMGIDVKLRTESNCAQGSRSYKALAAY